MAFIYLVFGKKYSVSDILINLSLSYNLFPGKHESIVWAGWTIGVEVIFYLIVPYFLLLIKNLLSAVVCCVAMIALSAFSYTFYMAEGYPKGYAYMSFLGSIGVFSFGIPAYFLYKKYNGRACDYFGGVIFLTFLILAAVVIYFERAIVQYVGNRSSIWGAVFALLIVSQCLKPIPLVSNRLFVFFGNLSFGIYLCHPVIIYLLQSVYKKIYNFSLGDGISFIICSVLSITLTVIAAQFAHVLIERNGMRFGDFLIAKRIARDNLA